MRTAPVLLAALGVAACNQQGDAGANRTAAGNGAVPAGAPAAAAALRPGRWEMTMRVISLDLPNAPPEMVEQLRAQPLPPPQVTANCMTPQEAADMGGNIRRQVVQNQANLSCDAGNQRFDSGQIRISLNCRGLNGQPDQRLAMVGSFTDSSLQTAITAASSMPAADGTMQEVRIESTLTGRRTGECTGTETE
jgi:hypothetical protein